LLYPLYVDNFLVNRAVHRTPFLYCAAPFLIPVARKKYRLRGEPSFLPTPVEVPATVVKATRPTVCFVGRWDRRKRPERFLALARDFPDVSFVSVGGTFDRRRDEALRQSYGSISNLEMTGFIDQFATDRLARILERSWVLINTSAREGLPNTFLEAAAHRCAILSQIDHEGFASRFGYYAADGDLRRGLAWLLAEERWRACGEMACEHARQVYATEPAIEAHLSAYRQALEARPGGKILCGDPR
jgi:glycosyltransferase involved in cell wall biosynthesis